MELPGKGVARMHDRGAFADRHACSGKRRPRAQTLMTNLLSCLNVHRRVALSSTVRPAGQPRSRESDILGPRTRLASSGPWPVMSKWAHFAAACVSIPHSPCSPFWLTLACRLGRLQCTYLADVCGLSSSLDVEHVCHGSSPVYVTGQRQPAAAASIFLFRTTTLPPHVTIHRQAQAPPKYLPGVSGALGSGRSAAIRNPKSSPGKRLSGVMSNCPNYHEQKGRTAGGNSLGYVLTSVPRQPSQPVVGHPGPRHIHSRRKKTAEVVVIPAAPDPTKVRAQFALGKARSGHARLGG